MKKKEAPSINDGEQAKSNERSDTTTMHATKQSKVVHEFVLQTIPIILKNVILEFGLESIDGKVDMKIQFEFIRR